MHQFVNATSLAKLRLIQMTILNGFANLHKPNTKRLDVPLDQKLEAVYTIKEVAQTVNLLS